MALNNYQNFSSAINVGQENKPKNLMIDGIVVSDRQTDLVSKFLNCV